MEWPRSFNATTVTGVTSIRTIAEHTEICPGKDRVRRDRILELQSDRRKAQGVVTISDALLPMLANLRHTGPIQCLDLEKAMCMSIDSHRPRYNKPDGNFPGMEILPALHMELSDAVQFLCDRGMERRFGLQDWDLTATISKLLMPVCLRPIQMLADCRWKGRIVITGSVRKDGFRSPSEREDYIRDYLPRGVHFIKCDSYSSNFYSRNREYMRRAPMCQFILQAAPIHGTNVMRRAA